MRGLKLDGDHDLSLDDGGRLEVVDSDEATAQEIKTRLLFFRGESFMDVREGVPYYQEILKKAPDMARIRAIIRAVILSVPSVIDVPVLEIAHDRATRSATVTWEARTRTGGVVRSADFGPLVLG